MDNIRQDMLEIASYRCLFHLLWLSRLQDTDHLWLLRRFLALDHPAHMDTLVRGFKHT